MKISAGNKGKKKGFTLIELLVVIAIIAILSVVVVITLNPSEMLRRSRDSNRISDFATIKSAINLYLQDLSISSSTSISMGTQGTCYIQYIGSAPTSVFEFATSSASEASTTVAYTVNATSVFPGGCGEWFNSATPATNAPNRSTSRSVSAGWIPINLTLISTGAPIGQWPADPASDVGSVAAGNPAASNLYFYIPGSNNQYKLAAKLESVQYSQGGTSDLESSDGGDDQFMYEQGSNLAL